MAAAVDLILAPYDCARRGARMGAGPEALLAAGLVGRLESEGVACRLVPVEPEKEFRAEIATTFDLHRGVRGAVEAASGARRLPVTLSGNCNIGVIGSLAAEGHEDVGLFWFDAHSDAETPESSTSGFLDGMGFAIALGACFAPLRASVGGAPLEGRRAAHVGAREVSQAARALLAERGVTLVPPETARSLPAREGLAPAFEALRSAGVRRVHVHVDLDVLDPELVGPANDWALPGGVSSVQLKALLEAILAEFHLASASVASYDPRLDRDGAVGAAGLEAIATLARG
ncbi:MAG TPA: arginase family protein [Allosphingosinicella sp.]